MVTTVTEVWQLHMNRSIKMVSKIVNLEKFEVVAIIRWKELLGKSVII